MNEFQSSVPPEHPLSARFRKYQLRSLRRHLALWCFASLLMMLVVSLTACASQPTQPCEHPVNPQPPALTEPLPSVDYSISVRESFKRWQSVLTGMSATSKP